MWRTNFLAAFLCACCYAGETPNSTKDTLDVWFTQIGTWHVVRDTQSGTNHLYHNASVDGARSGRAFADLKYNRSIFGLTRMSAELSVGRLSSAGLLLKNKKIAYCIYIEKGQQGDSVRIVKRFEQHYTRIASFAATETDTQRLEIDLSADFLGVTIGGISRRIRKPADLPAELTIGLTCIRGEVRVWKLGAQATSAIINESFTNPTVINLGLDKMFKTQRKSGR